MNGRALTSDTQGGAHPDGTCQCAVFNTALKHCPVVLYGGCVGQAGWDAEELAFGFQRLLCHVCNIVSRPCKEHDFSSRIT